MSNRPTSGKTKRPDKDCDGKDPAKAKDVKSEQDSSSAFSSGSGNSSVTGSTKTSNPTGSSQSRQVVKSTYYAVDDRPIGRGNGGRWDRSRDHRDTRPIVKAKDEYQSSRKRDSREMPHSKLDMKGKGHEYRERDGSSSSSTRSEYVSGDLRRQPGKYNQGTSNSVLFSDLFWSSYSINQSNSELIRSRLQFCRRNLAIPDELPVIVSEVHAIQESPGQ